MTVRTAIPATEQQAIAGHVMVDDPDAEERDVGG